MNSNLLSVVISAYNVETYIDRCLYTITKLLCYRGVEIIVVNDGSSDHTLSIINKYKSEYSSIIIVNQKNKGLSGARNSGLCNATGEYVWFVDGDDYINFESCNYLYDKLSDIKKYDILIFGRVEDYGNYRVENKCTKSCCEYSNGIEYFNSSIINGSYRTNAWDKIFRRDFLITCSLRFDEGLIYEDMFFVTKAFLNSGKVCSLPICPYTYVHYNNSSITKTIREKDLDVLKFLEMLNIYVHDRCICDPLLNKSIQILIFTWASSCILNKYALLSFDNYDAKDIMQKLIDNKIFIDSAYYCKSNYVGLRKMIMSNLLIVSPFLFKIILVILLQLKKIIFLIKSWHTILF